MNKKIVFLFLSFVFLVLFFAFSVIVKKHYLVQFDFDTTVRLQNHVPLRLDRFFPLFSFLASIQSMAIILAFILIFLRKWRGILIFLIFFASHLVELFGKVFINHPPPPFMFFRHNPYGFSFANDYVQQGNSFPSGHSMRTVFVAIVFTYLIYHINKLPRELKLMLFGGALLFVILVGISRISLGEHWATDVIGGGFFGAGMAFFSLLFI